MSHGVGPNDYRTGRQSTQLIRGEHLFASVAALEGHWPIGAGTEDSRGDKHDKRNPALVKNRLRVFDNIYEPIIKSHGDTVAYPVTVLGLARKPRVACSKKHVHLPCECAAFFLTNAVVSKYNRRSPKLPYTRPPHEGGR